MKKLFLPLLALLCLGLNNTANAQPCNVSNATISNVTRVADGGGTCTLKFDLDFTVDNNGGSKIIVVHLWPALVYPTLPYANATNAAELTTSYGTITIDNEIRAGHPAPTYMAYPFEAGVTNLVTVPTLIRTGVSPYNFHLSGITIPGVSCTNVIAIKGDVWATNAGALNTNANVHCVTQNINLVAGDPTLSQPFKTCANPRMINFIVGTTSATAIQVTYKIYRDDNFFSSGQPVFNPLLDVEVTNPGTMPLTVSSSTNAPVTTSFVGNATPGENSEYWVVATFTPPPGQGSSSSLAKITAAGCSSPLPVKLVSFNASRSGSNVLLKWETVSEENNAGFIVQRKIAGENWREIAFVPSEATNSGAQKIAYQHSDINNAKGITQYRIVQKDIDGKLSYSEVRPVKGQGQVLQLMSVFPNPAQGGNFSILFSTEDAYDVQLMDGSGRAIKQHMSVKGSKTFSSILKGQYLIIADNKQTGERTTQKIIVQ